MELLSVCEMMMTVTAMTMMMMTTKMLENGNSTEPREETDREILDQCSCQ